MTTTATKKLTLPDIQDWLADVRFRPFGGIEWSFDATRTLGSLDLVAINHFARDSRSYDWDDETDDWTLLDGHQQSFHMTVDWPQSWDRLKHSVAELVAYVGAHESLEWLNIDGAMPHDPHVDGDVVVRL